MEAMRNTRNRGISFCHIMPAQFLRAHGHLSSSDLVLAHVVENNREYAAYYEGTTKPVRILDNGAFELSKEGKTFDPNKLIDIAKQVNATHIVLPDFPGQNCYRTIGAGVQWAPLFKNAGFKTVFVPQGIIGDIEDFDKAVRFGVANGELFDVIALSILGVPNAYRVTNIPYQRFLARSVYLSTMKQRNPSLYDVLIDVAKPIHMLGLLDGPNEIMLVNNIRRSDLFNVVSWDSSAATWAGLNGVQFDSSPTGLLKGKFEEDVDFTFKCNEQYKIDLALKNIQVIEKLCEG